MQDEAQNWRIIGWRANLGLGCEALRQLPLSLTPDGREVGVSTPCSALRRRSAVRAWTELGWIRSLSHP